MADADAAVLDDAARHLLLRARVLGGVERLLQVQVERDHAPLDVDVFDHHLVTAGGAVVRDFKLAGGELFDFGEQLVAEALARKGHIAVFHGVGHAPHPVMLFHQQILALDLLAAGVFGGWVKVFDDFEHIGE